MAIAACDKAIGEEINIATGKDISIGQLAEELIRQINPAARVVCDAQRVRPENSEVWRLCGSAEKLRALTGWQPAYTFDGGVDSRAYGFVPHGCIRFVIEMTNYTNWRELECSTQP